MTELTKEKALKEGTAVRTLAEAITENYGVKGEPTKEMYAEAFSVLELTRDLTPEGADLLIKAVNLWQEIKTELGRDDASKFRTVYNDAVETCSQEIRGFIRGERQTDEVVGIIEETVAHSDIGKQIFSKHATLTPKMTRYVGLGLEWAKTVDDVLRE